MLKTAELLKVDSEALSEKCSEYSSVYVKQIIGKGMDRQALIDYTKEHFTADELLYMSLNWMNEKTEQVFKEILYERMSINKDKNTN